MPENPTPSSSPYILLVEDDVFLVRAYEAILSSEGYQVHVVADGEAALKTLAEEPLPAVILLDLMLPHKSGFEVLEAIGKDPRLAAVPVLVLSNLAQQGDVERAKALGAQGYFVKADTPLEQVVEAIKRYLPNGK